MSRPMATQKGLIPVKIADWNDARTHDIVARHYAYFTALEVNTTFNNPPSLDSYVASLKGPECILFVAWDASYETILGCGALTTFSSPITGHDGKLITNVGEVRAMHTLPAARGTGVGARLLGHIEQVAKDSGLIRLYIETGTLEGYAAARRLYIKAGFQECGAFGRYVKHPDLFCMFKEL